MSRKAREIAMRKINARARSKSLLPSIDRELTLNEIAVMTRAGQSKALGLTNKGHLGPGADADIAVYNLNPENTDLSKEYRKLRRVFRKAAYTIKSGQIVAKAGDIVKHVDGATMWVDLQTSEPAEITRDMKKRFKAYWTVEYDNYPVTDEYLKVSNPIAVKASV